MLWVVSGSEAAPTNYACFILAYIAIILIVTITVLTIMNIRNRRINPLVPDTDRPTLKMSLVEGLDRKMKLALVGAILLLSTGIFLIMVEIVN